MPRPRKPRHRPQKLEWEIAGKELQIRLGIAGTPGGEAQLIIDASSPDGAIRLEVPGDADKPPRAWEGLPWAELQLTKTSFAAGRWSLTISPEHELLGRLMAGGHDLELSWGRRRGEQRGTIGRKSPLEPSYKSVVRDG